MLQDTIHNIAGVLMRVGQSFFRGLQAAGGRKLFFDVAGNKVRKLQADVMQRTRTAKQTIQVLNSAEYGYMLVLDDEIQFAVSDEDIYHTHLVQPAIDCLKKQNKQANVLILGGGDGLALKKVLSFPLVERVVLVDHDPELLHLFVDGELGRLFGTADAFKDKRTTLIISDVYDFLKSPNSPIWDIIIVDLTDAATDISSLSTAISSISAVDTLISMHAPSDNTPGQLINPMRQHGLECVASWRLPIPSFGEDWLFILCVKEGGVRPELDPAWKSSQIVIG